MSKEDYINIAKYIAVMIVLYFCIWTGGKLFADSVSDYEIIKPKEGVECVVVSRMFNTSVDCWKSI